MWDGRDRSWDQVGIVEDSLVEGRVGRDGDRDDVEGEGEGEGEDGGGEAVVVGDVAVVGFVGWEGSKLGMPWKGMALVHQKEEGEEGERKVAGSRTLVEQGYLVFFVVAGCSKEESEWGTRWTER